MYFHVLHHKKIYFAFADQLILILLVPFESLMNKEMFCIFSSNSLDGFKSCKGLDILQVFLKIV